MPRHLKLDSDIFTSAEKLPFINKNVYVTNSQTRFSTKSFRFHDSKATTHDMGVSKGSKHILKFEHYVGAFNFMVNSSR